MEYNTKNLFIDFTKCPKDKRLSDFFTELSVWPEFTECKSDNIIKIAILSGDIESDFVSISDRNQMLRAIFEYLKIDYRTKKNENLFRTIEDYTNPDFMRAWFRYMYISNEMDFTQWLMLKADYAMILKDMAEPVKGDQTPSAKAAYLRGRKENRVQLGEIIQELKEIESKLFPDSRAARQMVNTERKIKVYAEKYAEEGTFV